MKYVLFVLLALLSGSSIAQQSSPFKLRFDEDYPFLAKDTTRDCHKSYKYISFGKNSGSCLSLGGEIRLQYLYFQNEDWGSSTDDGDGFTLTRLLSHANVHISSKIRFFTEIQIALVNSRLGPIVAAEENPLEIHQIFADWKAINKSSVDWTIRAGRQELSYGSQRVISLRNFPNTKLSFDGIRTMISSSTVDLDLFYTHPVAKQTGIFDDGFNNDSKLWGGYLTHKKVIRSQNLDVYYLGLWKREAVFDDGKGPELRHTFGTRIWNDVGNWKYDFEVGYQSGSFSEKNISAAGVSLSTSYRFNKAKLKPEVGIKTAIITGDRKYEDRTLHTLNPLFAQGSYFGLAAKLNPANLMDIHPNFSVSLGSKLLTTFDCAFIWRYSINDGIYRPNMSVLYSGRQTSSRYVGEQLSASFICLPDRFFTIMTGISWFKAGEYLKQASPGKNTFLGFAMAQFKF